MSTAIVLDNTFGAMFVGVMLAATLWGVSCVQVWYYFTKFPSDAWHLKLLVAVVFCSDLLHQIFISHTIYTYLITNYANPLFLTQIVWSLVAQVIVSGTTAFLVQCFYVTRIWRLSRHNWIVTGAVFVLVAAEYAMILEYSVHAFKLDSLLEIGQVLTESKLINGFGAASDVAIAVAMVILLNRARTGFRHSDGVINRLMMFVINSGLLTSICALCSLIAVLASPNSYIYICFFFTLGRLYSNSLLVALNSRTSSRTLDARSEEISVSLDRTARSVNGMHSTRGARTPQLGRSVKGDISINVEQTTEFSRDDDYVAYEMKEPSLTQGHAV